MAMTSICSTLRHLGTSPATGIIGPRRMIRLVLVESLLSTGFLIQLIPLQTRPLDEFKCRVGLWAGARGIQLLPNVISILSLDH